MATADQSTFARIAAMFQKLLAFSPVDDVARSEIQSLINELALVEQSEATGLAKEDQDFAGQGQRLDDLTDRMTAVEASLEKLIAALDPGPDTTVDGAGAESVNGAAGENSVSGEAAASTVDGGAGNDSIGS